MLTKGLCHAQFSSSYSLFFFSCDINMMNLKGLSASKGASASKSKVTFFFSDFLIFFGDWIYKS